MQAIISSKTSVHGNNANVIYFFDLQVRPILKYALDICYQEKPKEDLERVQLTYQKYLEFPQEHPTWLCMEKPDNFAAISIGKTLASNYEYAE